MDKHTGGQAFPHGDPTHGGDIGMTLRDYFAAKAMGGMCATAGYQGLPWDDCAKHAYEAADALLRAR